MEAGEKIHIGMLSPDTANRPHFQSFQKLLPAGVALTNEGLGLLRSSYHDLGGKTDEIIARAAKYLNVGDAPEWAGRGARTVLDREMVWGDLVDEQRRCRRDSQS